MAVEAPGLEKVPAKVGGVSETVLLRTDENSARVFSLCRQTPPDLSRRPCMCGGSELGVGGGRPLSGWA